MATKLSKVQVEKMNDLNLGFTAKTEEQAREQLLEWLEAHGLPGMEQETFDNLLDIVGSMSSISSDEAQDAVPDSAEAELMNWPRRPLRKKLRLMTTKRPPLPLRL